MPKHLKTERELLSLRAGDIITSRASGLGYVVLCQSGRGLVAVHTIIVTNPDEWDAYTIDGKRV